MMKPFLVALAALIMASPALPARAETAPIEVAVVEHRDGMRSLVHETIVDAPPAAVWKAFSTVEGWKSWGVQFVEMDFRTGGSIESGYAEGAAAGDPHNIVQRILALIPQRLLATRVERAPEGGPVDDDTLAQLWAVYELEPLDDGRTRLRISGHGYGTGEKFDRMIEFFKRGNTASIELMRQTIEDAAG